nr:hypothetical protein [Lentzea sp. NEAU-D7]
MLPGVPERQCFDHVRHDTTSLFAAQEIATGQVISALKRRHRRQDFLALCGSSIYDGSVAMMAADRPSGFFAEDPGGELGFVMAWTVPPGSGRRLRMAMSSALPTRVESCAESIGQPTNRRLNASRPAVE